jgi:GNAT superfamily N-acetyltransferase
MYEIKYIHNRILITDVQNNENICECECIEIERTYISKEKGLYVINIFTHPSYRNKGYASNMIYFIKNLCEKKDYKYIILDDSTGSSPPHNLYYKLNCLVKNFYQNYDYTWVRWKDNTDLSIDEERLWFI